MLVRLRPNSVIVKRGDGVVRQCGLWTILAFLALALGAVASRPSHGGEPRPVALKLILAIDVSASVDAQEYKLQRDGIVAAFRDARLVAAIESLGERGMAVSLLQWAASWEQALVVGWSLVDDRASAEVFARRVALSPRVFAGEGTSISQALHFARQVMGDSDFLGQRRVVDLSGDGRNNSGAEPAVARAQILAEGVTVNGLAVLGQDTELGSYFRDQVMGGTAAFVEVARDFNDYADAILRKLLRELQPPLAINRNPGFSPRASRGYDKGDKEFRTPRTKSRDSMKREIWREARN